MKYILFFFALFFSHTLSAQPLSYTFPRDTSYFKGSVKHLFHYEYPNLLHIDEKATNPTHDSTFLSRSFHFNEEGIQTHRVSYRKGIINRIKFFLYNEQNNISYTIEQDAEQIPIHSTNELLELIENKVVTDTSLSAKYIILRKLL